MNEAEARAEYEAARAAYDAADRALDAARDRLRAATDAKAIACRERRPREDELTYALGAACPCGAPLAYWSDEKPSAWDCADVLLGRAPEPVSVLVKELGPPPVDLPTDVVLHHRLPFWCWKVKVDHDRKAR